VLKAVRFFGLKGSLRPPGHRGRKGSMGAELWTNGVFFGGYDNLAAGRQVEGREVVCPVDK
jgi:hypothetical protein